MSYVLRLTSSRLVSRVSRPLALATLVSCLASSLPCAAMTNTLVYVAEFGKFNAAGEVETFSDLTTNVTMTVALYSKKGAASLWNRRLTVPVWRGQFAVELDDALGYSDQTLTPPSTCKTLAEVFANAQPSDAWYVGISRVRSGSDENPPAGMDDTEKVGKISAVPFAVEAERATGALGDFTVSGTATVGKMSVQGALLVSDAVTFCQPVTCNGGVTIDGRTGGLTVSGELTIESGDLNLMGLDTRVSAGNTEATLSFSTSDLTVNGGAVLSATDGLTSLKCVTADTLVASQGLEAASVSAKSVTVAGKLTLPDGGKLDWHTVSNRTPSLTAPDGVYEAAATAEDLTTKTNPTVANASDKERLDSFAMATVAGKTATNALTATSRETAIRATTDWCYSGAAASSDALVTLTSLCPFAPQSSTAKDTLAVTNGTVVSHTTKELTK